MTDEKIKKVMSFTCECGSILNSKQALQRHLSTRKHKILIGEIIIPPKVKPSPKKRGRKLSAGSPENITEILNTKVENLSEEDANIRREYYKKKQQEYRDRKKCVLK